MTSSDARVLQELAREFPLETDLVYLNHAAVAPWPRRTADAVRAFALENQVRGARDYPRWLMVERRLRERLQRLINAPAAADIALLKNTSEALSVVAHGLPWNPGDQVVITDQEFPSNRIVWESLAPRGVDLVAAPITGATDPEAAIADCLGPKTRLLAVSSVQYGTGLRLDLPRLGALCREQGAWFVIDAIQSLGAHELDVQAAHGDFLMADGHKWMLGPEGVAVFYCRAALRDTLDLHQYGWHMVADPGNFDRRDWSVGPDARRFECGSPNMLGIHALDASLSLLEDAGMVQIEQQILKKTTLLIDLLTEKDCEILTPRDPRRRAGIVTFRPGGVADLSALHLHLMSQGVICAQRGGGIRFSPHFYTPDAVLRKGVQACFRP